MTKAGHLAYFAGGCVRDHLLQREAKDIDIATNASPDQVQKLFPKVSDLQGKAFGVIRIQHQGESFEIAMFRQESGYQDGRRPDHVEPATPEKDAERRDFTINGLFYDPLQEKVLNYVGGIADLKKKWIRGIGDPVMRFTEDKLRLFRAVRFAAQLDFEIETETWKALCNLAPSSGQLACERVRDELVKALCSPQPLKAFDLLDFSGLFDVWIPEISLMKGVEQPPQFHPEGDVHQHVRLMFSHLSNPDPVLALGVLFHDIAKPDTFKVDPTGRIRFNEHEHVGARKTEKIMKRLRFSNEMIKDVCTLVANHMAFKDVPHMRLSTLKKFLARPTMDLELELHRIDCSSSHRLLDIYELVLEKRGELSQEELKPVPLVNGNDLIELGLAPGKLMGQVLNTLMDEQLEGKFKDREQALRRAKALINGLVE
ncbi:MAG: CCA tRNA nucleotidyltransferase [Blastochloris sp.]|nr:CCA tRNA nucleotidyltransferase [Blastochloris sp.]